MTVNTGEPASGARPPGRPDPAHRLGQYLPAVAATLIVAGGIAYVVGVYAPAVRAEVMAEWRERLRAMAHYGSAAIAQWATQGTADASTVATFPSVIASLEVAEGRREALAAPGVSIDEDLYALLDDVRRAQAFDALFVLDRRGEVRGQVPVERRFHEACRTAARETLQGGHGLADIHRHADGSVAVAFRALIRRRGSGAPGREEPVLGLVQFERRPSYWLYPFLTRDPTFTATGEALLVRAQTGEIKALSPLRKSPDSPLSRRMAQPDTLIRALGAQDAPVFVPHRDYSGASVLAAARQVPNTNWSLLVKVDEREALAQYRSRLWSAGLSVAILGLSTGTVAAAAWRRRRRRWEKAIARGEARQALLLDHANDAVIFVGPDGRIADVNRRAEQMYGRGRKRLVGLHVGELRPEALRHRVEADLERARSWSGAIFETEHLRADGTPFPVEVSSRQVSPALDRTVMSIVRDVTERRDAARAIERINRLLRTVSGVHRAIVRETRVEPLLAECCRILTGDGAFRAAWVGRADQATAGVVPIAWSDSLEDYLADVGIRFDDSVRGRGPTGTAARTRQAVVCNDTAADPAMAPWRQAQASRGFHASAAFPIRVGPDVFGTLCVFAAEVGVFGDEQCLLLQDLADDLGHALLAIEGREGLRRATAEATRSAAEIRRLNEELERRVAERTAQLEAANRELEAFSYSVSHDLRAPLRAVDGFGRILEEDHGAALGREGRRLLAVVRSNTRRMGQLIDDLLAFSRAGRSEVDLARVDLARLATSVFEDIVPAAARERIQFSVEDLPEPRGDRALLRQVLANLISNAVKFSEPRPHPVIAIGYETTPNGPAYFVRDNGVGFDMRYADKLFGVFQRLHSLREFDGTGVGLALVDRIVRRHGGSIWAASEPAARTTFWFTLPAGDREVRG